MCGGADSWAWAQVWRTGDAQQAARKLVEYALRSARPLLLSAQGGGVFKIGAQEGLRLPVPLARQCPGGVKMRGVASSFSAACACAGLHTRLARGGVFLFCLRSVPVSSRLPRMSRLPLASHVSLASRLACLACLLRSALPLRCASRTITRRPGVVRVLSTLGRASSTCLSHFRHARTYVSWPLEACAQQLSLFALPHQSAAH